MARSASLIDSSGVGGNLTLASAIRIKFTGFPPESSMKGKQRTPRDRVRAAHSRFAGRPLLVVRVNDKCQAMCPPERRK